jgi:hypothetical protein
MLRSWFRVVMPAVLVLVLNLFSGSVAWAAICPVCGLDTSIPYCPGYRVADEHHPAEKARRSVVSPSRIAVGVREGSLELRGAGGGKLTRGEVAAFGERPALLVDVSDLVADPASFKSMARLFEQYPGAISFTTQAEQAAVRRWQVLPRWTELRVRSDGQALRSVGGYGPLADDLLADLTAGRAGGRVLRFEVSHEAGDAAFIQNLTRRALAGEFRGQHLAVGICEVDMGELLALQDAVLANGGRSCLIPSAKMDIQPMVLAARELRLNPRLLAEATPREALWRGYDVAAKKAWNCLQVDDAALEGALRTEFGDDAIGLFRLNGDGPVDRAVVTRVFRGLLYNKFKFLEFVDSGIQLDVRNRLVG